MLFGATVPTSGFAFPAADSPLNRQAADTGGPTRMTGDRELPDFESVILPHLDEAYSLARWLMRGASEAQDVVQEAFVRALTYFHTFNGTNARAWILQIVRNAAYSALRKQRDAGVILPLDVHDLDDDDDEWSAAVVLCDPCADPEALLAEAQERKRLDVLLGELPVALRECIVLHDINGFSYKQIAAIIDAPIGTVMSRLWRGRRMLIKLAAESDP
jgi:RNA polymerase sigma factor (sigma-70 family)